VNARDGLPRPPLCAAAGHDCAAALRRTGQPIGLSTSSWANFVPGVPASSNWDNIKGLDNCPQYNDCNDNSQMRMG
jgi:hypothetical protein